DEPTAMLDAENAAAVRATVEQVADRHHLTTVVVEHLLGPWVDFADRLLVLDADGRIVADGAPRVVLAEYGATLAEQGIWVPGVPAPAPIAFATSPFAPRLPARIDHDPGAKVTQRRTSPASGRATLGDFRTGAGREAAAVVVAAQHVRVERRETLLGGETRTTLALEDATASGRSGELTAVIGPSGSGKSTLLLALAGLVPITTGEATDPKLSSPDLARLLAWVPQWSSSTIVARTVLDETLVTARALGLDDAVCRARAETLLRAVGLWGLRNADPRHLSGGEQRRLAMVAALVHEPRALLADEPTVGQDRLTWAAVMGVVEAYRAAGGAVVTATHDASLIDRAHEVVTLTAPETTAPERLSRRPLLSRAGPLSLLAGALLSIPAGIVSPGWRWSLLVLAAQVILGGIGLSTVGGRGPRPTRRAKRVAMRMIPGLLGALSVGWSTWLLGGHDLGLAATGVLRVLIIVFPSAVLIPYVDPDALGDHLAQRLHLPARPVVAMSAALQRLHTFGAIRAEITGSRRVRGLGGRLGAGAAAAAIAALTVGLLVRSLGAAAQLAVAMDARGFATATRRTWWATAPWRTADVLVVLAAAVPTLIAVLARTVC
ncbi:MAG: ATP-binding cassette domain-containing protein, partial [Nostocoides sp.]